jgi:LPPG:FO 2-phospho-L-lactate transferase
MYTLAGVSNPETGWGLIDETFQTLESLKMYGADAWFGLGDKDLATHIRRTDMLRSGYALSEITRSLSAALGIRHPIVPMTDNRVRTRVTTELGELAFQEYFVKLRCEPMVKSLRFEGAEAASPAPAFSQALEQSRAIVFCPSNPFVSVAPILAVPGVRKGIEGFGGLRVAVSPIVGGKALKGPAAKMLGELGHDVSCVGVAGRYVGLCDVFIIDEEDRAVGARIEELGMRVEVTDTIMNTEEDKIRLAKFICELKS